MDNFAVLITTHGRPNNQATYSSLRRCGYTGKIYLIVDNEDATLAEYSRLYGDEVIVFDKAAWAEKVDAMDNLPDRRAVVYARNAVFEIAKDLGLEYFLEVDDDYNDWQYRFRRLGKLMCYSVGDLDNLFSLFIQYLRSIDALSIAMAQGGDFIGGAAGQFGSAICSKRKVMNTFFCSVDRPFPFVGRMNDDVNTYVALGNRGGLFLTTSAVMITQAQTQAVSGGMSDVYINEGTYRKSFYTVMLAPSCVKIRGIGSKRRRIHHSIEWGNAVPCILREKHRKPR